MLSKIRHILFPCEAKMKVLRNAQKDAVLRQDTAQQRLVAACRGEVCHRFSFPALKDKHIVSPR